MSYLLSKCKIATPETTRLSVRLDLLSMYEKNSQELEDLRLTAQTLSYRIEARGGVSPMKRQCEAMQIYLSAVTTDWAKQAASRQNGWSR